MRTADTQTERGEDGLQNTLHDLAPALKCGDPTSWFAVTLQRFYAELPAKR